MDSLTKTKQKEYMKICYTLVEKELTGLGGAR